MKDEFQEWFNSRPYLRNADGFSAELAWNFQQEKIDELKSQFEEKLQALNTEHQAILKKVRTELAELQVEYYDLKDTRFEKCQELIDLRDEVERLRIRLPSSGDRAE
jgi:predicted nuclease with TOPRIM domain